MRATVSTLLWMGGTAVQPALTKTRLRDNKDKYVNISNAVAGGRLPHEARRLEAVRLPSTSPRVGSILRSDIYDELLKLPLRYKLHPFEKLVEARVSAVSGYGLPLGPVDLDDTIPFHAHRHSSGYFYIAPQSMHARNLDPAKTLHIQLVEGDLHRLDDELIKIFPSKKIFIKEHKLIMYNSSNDVKQIIEHWFLGLGF